MNTASLIVALLTALVVLLPLDVGAETASAAAHVRFWKTALAELSRVRVSSKTGTGKHASAHDLGSAGPGFSFENYADTPSGHVTLEVYAGENKTPVTTLPAEFTPDSFMTVLVKEPRKAGEPPQIEVILDSTGAQPAGGVPSQIRVRNFVADIKDIHVTIGDALNAQFTGDDDYLNMKGMKPIVYPVRTVGTGTGGKPFEWNTEADLRQHHRQTLLIYPDPYGRIRPRMVVDGESQGEPADGQGGQR